MLFENGWSILVVGCQLLSCQVINWHIFRSESIERRKILNLLRGLRLVLVGGPVALQITGFQLFKMDVLRPAASALFIVVAKVINQVIIVELNQVIFYLLIIGLITEHIQ